VKRLLDLTHSISSSLYGLFELSKGFLILLTTALARGTRPAELVNELLDLVKSFNHWNSTVEFAIRLFALVISDV
jgi:hypothetical protein